MNKANISLCYQNRFSEKDRRMKQKMWKELCGIFIQKFISKNDTVMDIGSGYCEFINSINCGKKIAIDADPNIKKSANKDVLVINKNVFRLSNKYDKTVDVVFLSNILEHLNNKDDVIKLLLKVNRLLKKNGKIILLQPNIDLVKESYWDFIDHRVALNTKSIREALEITGFKIEVFIKKFLPYTTKNASIPMSRFLLKIYLSLPQIFRPFAGQTLAVAFKKVNV